MNKQCKLSDVTQRYLEQFYMILDGMVQGMTEAELTNSISHNFIVQMIPHHRAAIEMSENLLQYTTNVPLQNIAQNIVEEQTESIEDMCRILDECGCLENTDRALCLYQRKMNQIRQNMVSRMGNSVVTNSVDLDFICEMIPHHEGAIAMSEHTLRFDICPGLNPILEAIITSQERGVQQMKALLKCIK